MISKGSHNNEKGVMILTKEQAKIMKETAIMKTFNGMPYWVRPTTNEKGKENE